VQEIVISLNGMYRVDYKMVRESRGLIMPTLKDKEAPTWWFVLHIRKLFMSCGDDK
jgi:hypothetical protein